MRKDLGLCIIENAKALLAHNREKKYIQKKKQKQVKKAKHLEQKEGKEIEEHKLMIYIRKISPVGGRGST